MSFDWHSYVTAWDAVASKNVECELIRIWESIHLNMYEIVFMLFYGCKVQEMLGNVGHESMSVSGLPGRAVTQN